MVNGIHNRNQSYSFFYRITPLGIAWAESVLLSFLVAQQPPRLHFTLPIFENKTKQVGWAFSEVCQGNIGILPVFKLFFRSLVFLL